MIQHKSVSEQEEIGLFQTWANKNDEYVLIIGINEGFLMTQHTTNMEFEKFPIGDFIASFYKVN